MRNTMDVAKTPNFHTVTKYFHVRGNVRVRKPLQSRCAYYIFFSVPLCTSLLMVVIFIMILLIGYVKQIIYYNCYTNKKN